MASREDAVRSASLQTARFWLLVESGLYQDFRHSRSDRASPRRPAPLLDQPPRARPAHRQPRRGDPAARPQAVQPRPRPRTPGLPCLGRAPARLRRRQQTSPCWPRPPDERSFGRTPQWAPEGQRPRFALMRSARRLYHLAFSQAAEPQVTGAASSAAPGRHGLGAALYLVEVADGVFGSEVLLQR